MGISWGYHLGLIYAGFFLGDRMGFLLLRFSLWTWKMVLDELMDVFVGTLYSNQTWQWTSQQFK